MLIPLLSSWSAFPALCALSMISCAINFSQDKLYKFLQINLIYKSFKKTSSAHICCLIIYLFDSLFCLIRTVGRNLSFALKQFYNLALWAHVAQSG